MKKTSFKDTLYDETRWQPESTINDKEMVVILKGKVVTLLDSYGIPGGLDDPMNGWSLVLRLAHDLIPGFVPTYRRPRRPAHRPHDLSVGHRDVYTYVYLERARREGRFVRQAARELAEKLRKEGKCGWNGESLRQRYLQIRRSGVPTKGMLMAVADVRGGST